MNREFRVKRRLLMSSVVSKSQNTGVSGIFVSVWGNESFRKVGKGLTIENTMIFGDCPLLCALYGQKSGGGEIF